MCEDYFQDYSAHPGTYVAETHTHTHTHTDRHTELLPELLAGATAIEGERYTTFLRVEKVKK